MKELIIRGSIEVKVDDDHHEVLMQLRYPWYQDDSGYVICWLPQSQIFLRLHNWVMDYVGDLDIDHKNRIKTDCQRDNLVIVEHYLNLHNQKIRTDNTTGYKGIFLNRAGNWGWQTWIKGKKFTKQGFNSKEEAYQAKLEFLASQGITQTGEGPKLYSTKEYN